MLNQNKGYLGKIHLNIPAVPISQHLFKTQLHQFKKFKCSRCSNYCKTCSCCSVDAARGRAEGSKTYTKQSRKMISNFFPKSSHTDIMRAMQLLNSRQSYQIVDEDISKRRFTSYIMRNTVRAVKKSSFESYCGKGTKTETAY